ncbi:MAG: TetR/AcrR family transcriptional regulator [Desulfuromonadia bacterium]
MEVYRMNVQSGSFPPLSDKENQIIDAAIDLIAREGFHGAPMGEIARRAGVATGTVYCYFESKDQLILRAYERVEQECLAAILDGYSESSPFPDRFCHLCRSLLLHLCATPTTFRFIEQFHHSPYGIQCRRERFSGSRGQGFFTDLFQEGVSSGEIRPLPIPVLYSLTFGPLIDLVRHHILGIVILDDPLIHQVVEACLDSIRTPSSPRKEST